MLETKASKSCGVKISPELVAEAKAGDQAAFAELYEQTSAELYRSVCSMVRDEDLAWDVLQDSYLRAWRGLVKLEANEAFLPWLRRIAVNVAVTTLSRRQPLRFTELAGEENEAEPELPDLNPVTQPELALDRKESARLVKEILAGLPEEQQLIVGMRYYEDMSIQDISETLQIAPGTVKAQLFKGRKKVEAGVRAMEKQGVKLWGLAPMPFLLGLLRRLEPAAGAEKATLSAVLAEAPTAGSAAAAAAGETAAVTAMTAGQAFLHGLGTKLLAGALALTVIIGGGKLAYDALKKGSEPPAGPERLTATETVAPMESDGLHGSDTAEDLPVASDEDPSSTDDPASTEATEPTETTEPTEPDASTEPEDIVTGTHGSNLTWTLNRRTGELIIEGSGDMADLYSPPRWVMDHAKEIKSVQLPEGLRSISQGAFSGCSELEAITIPGSVATIGDQAFNVCTGLRTLNLSEGLQTINRWAFQGCSGLSTVSLPKSLTEIGYEAFEYCSGLTAFSVDPGSQSFSADRNGVLYDKDGSTLVLCPAGKSGRFELPKGVTTVKNHAFTTCNKLTEVILPDGVIEIGEYAFEYCDELRAITIPEGVARIGGSAFWDCGQLRSVVIPGTVSYIGPFAFNDCSGMTALTLSEGVTELDYHAFHGCTGLRSVEFPKSLRSLGSAAFTECTGLTSIIFHEGLTEIGNSAFQDCSALEEVSIPDSVNTIDRQAFSGCAELRSATIPANVTTIGDFAFSGCSKLTIRGVPGSEAERYASENGIPFEALS